MAATMESGKTAHPGSPNRKRGWKISGITLGAVLVLVGGAAALLSRPPALARAIELASGGAVHIEGAQGSLAGPLMVTRVRFTNQDVDLTLTDLELDWQPRLLRDGLLRIDRLTAGSVSVVPQPSPAPEPPTPPADFALPVTVEAPVVRVRRFEVRDPGAKTPTFDLTDATLQVRGGKPHFEVDFQGVSPSLGQMALQLKLGIDGIAPYALSADLNAERPDDPKIGRISAVADGNAGDLRLMAKVAARQRPEPLATAELRLTPFAAVPLADATVIADRFDPADWGAGVRADLSIRARFKETVPSQYAGSVDVRNHAPGPADQERLPLVALSSKVDGSATRLDFSQLLIDLGKAGRFDGAGRWVDQRLVLNLATRKLDLRPLATQLRATALAGNIGVEADAAGQTVTAELAELPGKGSTGLSFHVRAGREAARENGRPERLQVTAQAGGKRLGELDLKAGLESVVRGNPAADAKTTAETVRKFTATGTLKRIDLSALGDFPASRLNASFTGHGELAAKPSATIKADIADSELQGYPLAGRIAGRWQQNRADQIDVALSAAGNTLTAKGAFGGVADHFDWQVDAPALDRLGQKFRGTARGQGSVAGGFDSPSLQANLKADQLRLPGGIGVDSLTLEGEFRVVDDGPFKLDAAASGVRSGDKVVVESLQVGGSGKATQHQLAIALRGSGVDAETRLRGGYFHAEREWRGVIERLDNRGRWAARLRSTASLAAAPDKVRLANGDFDFGGGRINLGHFEWANGAISSSGSAQRLAIAPLLEAAGQKPLQTTLVASGRWQVDTAADQADIELKRDEGDLTLPAGDTSLKLGLSELALAAKVERGQLRATARIDGTLPGTIRVTAQTAIRKGADGIWQLPADAPLEGTVDASVPSLRWLAALGDGRWAVDGQLDAKLAAAGTLNDPQLSGRIQGSALKIVELEQGINFRGMLDAHLEGRDLVLKTLELEAGEGQLTASGRASFKADAPTAGITWRAKGFEAVKRPDRRLVVTGQGDVDWRDQRVTARGNLVFDSGLVALTDQEGLTVSEDVVVVGRGPKAEAAPAQLPLRLDINADLGENFTLRGQGIDTRLAGQLHVATSPAGRLGVTGTVKTAEGTYRAYGQQLAIERGIVAFNGPLDNPSLDILALRKEQEVEAGVAIGGTAQRPRVRLVSNPNVPDSEKLSWLVLGHGTNEGNASEFAALQAAARALLSQSATAPIEKQLAKSLGVDEISFKRSSASASKNGNGAAGATVALGKRISSRVYVAYEQGLAGAAGLVKITYTLSKRWNVRLAAGSDNAVDVFYKFSFD